jgi:aminomethyltransferase
MSTEQAAAAATRPVLRRSPLHHRHPALGARLGEWEGWQMPLAYADPTAEVAAARTGLALADVSAFAKLSLFGRGVPAFVATALPDTPAAAPGGVVRFVGDPDTLACRLTDDHLLLLSGGAKLHDLHAHVDRIAEAGPLRQDATTAQAMFCLFGPRTDEMLARLTALDPIRLPEGACAETGFASVHALLVRPPGLAVPSVRVLVAWDLAEYVWDRLLDAGRGEGIRPLGLDTLRGLLRG